MVCKPVISFPQCLYFAQFCPNNAYSDPLLLADVFEIFTNMCLKIYQLDPANLRLAPRLSWKIALKKVNIKLDLLTDIDMLLMADIGIRGK